MTTTLLPRFPTYRTALNNLFHNKGIDLAFITNLFLAQEAPFLVECIIFLLDRPSINPTLRPGLTELQSRTTALLPGFRSTELATIEFLGLNYGRRPVSPRCSYLATQFMSFTPDMIDLIRIIRSRSNWATGREFRQAVESSPYHTFKHHAVTSLSNIMSDDYIQTGLLSFAFQLAFTGDETPMSLPSTLALSTLTPSTAPTTSSQPLDSFNLWFGTHPSITAPLHELLDIDSLSSHNIASYQDYHHFTTKAFHFLLATLIKSGNIRAFSTICLQRQPTSTPQPHRFALSPTTTTQPIKTHLQFPILNHVQDEVYPTLRYDIHPIPIALRSYLIDLHNPFRPLTYAYNLSFAFRNEIDRLSAHPPSQLITHHIAVLQSIQSTHRAFFTTLFHHFGVDMLPPQDITHITLLAIAYNDTEIQTLLTQLGVDLAPFYDFIPSKMFDPSTLQSSSHSTLHKLIDFTDISQLYKNTARFAFRKNTKSEAGLHFTTLSDKQLVNSIFTSSLHFQHTALLELLFIPYIFTLSSSIITTISRSEFIRPAMYQWLILTLLTPLHQPLNKLHQLNNKSSLQYSHDQSPPTFLNLDSILDVRSPRSAENIWCILLLNHSLPNPVKTDLIQTLLDTYKSYPQTLPLGLTESTSASISPPQSPQAQPNHPSHHLDNPPTRQSYASQHPEIPFAILTQTILPSLLHSFQSAIQFPLQPTPPLSLSKTPTTTLPPTHHRAPTELLRTLLSSNLISPKAWSNLSTSHGINTCLDLMLATATELYSDIFIHTFSLRDAHTQRFIHSQILDLYRFILNDLPPDSTNTSQPTAPSSTKSPSSDLLSISPDFTFGCGNTSNNPSQKRTQPPSFDSALRSIQGTRAVSQTFLPLYLRIYSSRNIPLLKYISTKFKPLIETIQLESKLTLLQSVLFYLPPVFLDLNDCTSLPSPSDLLPASQLTLVEAQDDHLEPQSQPTPSKKTWKQQMKQHERWAQENHPNAFRSYDRFQIQFQSHIAQCTATPHQDISLHFETMCCDAKSLKQSVLNLFHLEDTQSGSKSTQTTAQTPQAQTQALDVVRQNLYGEIPPGYHPINDFCTTPSLLCSPTISKTINFFTVSKLTEQSQIYLQPDPPTRDQLAGLSEAETEAIMQGYRTALLQFQQHQLLRESTLQQSLLKLAAPSNQHSPVPNQSGLESFLGFQRGIAYTRALFAANEATPAFLRSTTLSQLSILWNALEVRPGARLNADYQHIIEEETPSKLLATVLTTPHSLRHLPFLLLSNPIISTIISQLSPQPAYPLLFGILKQAQGHSLFRPICVNWGLPSQQPGYFQSPFSFSSSFNDRPEAREFTSFQYSPLHPSLQTVSPTLSMTSLIFQQDIIANELINIIGSVDPAGLVATFSQSAAPSAQFQAKHRTFFTSLIDDYTVATSKGGSQTKDSYTSPLSAYTIQATNSSQPLSSQILTHRQAIDALPTTIATSLQQFITTSLQTTATSSSPDKSTSLVSSFLTLFGYQSTPPPSLPAPTTSQFALDILTTTITAAVISHMMEHDEANPLDFVAQHAEYNELYNAWARRLPSASPQEKDQGKQRQLDKCQLPPLKPPHILRTLHGMSTPGDLTDLASAPEQAQLPLHPAQLFGAHHIPSARPFAALLQLFQCPINQPFLKLILNAAWFHSSGPADIFDLYVASGGLLVYNNLHEKQRLDALQAQQDLSQSQLTAQLSTQSHPTLSPLFPNIHLFPPSRQLELLQVHHPGVFQLTAQSSTITPWYEQPLFYHWQSTAGPYWTEHQVYKFWLFSLHKLSPNMTDSQSIALERRHQIKDELSKYYEDPASYTAATADKLLASKALVAASSFASDTLSHCASILGTAHEWTQKATSTVAPILLPGLIAGASLYSTAILATYAVEVYGSLYPPDDATPHPPQTKRVNKSSRKPQPQSSIDDVDDDDDDGYHHYHPGPRTESTEFDDQHLDQEPPRVSDFEQYYPSNRPVHETHGSRSSSPPRPRHFTAY